MQVDDFVVTADRNELLIREDTGDLELRICLKDDLLQKLDSLELPHDFRLQTVGDLSIAIEELSHFNTVCLRAIENRKISALELEVQAEVDKFGIFIDWLHQRNENHLKENIFNALFENFQLGHWVAPTEAARYEDAHRIAKNFCRGLLRDDLNHSDFRAKLREFFTEPASSKLSSKY